MLIPLVALAMMQSRPVEIPISQRGTWLFQACQGAVRWLDAPMSNKPNGEDAENFDNCTAYIGGFLESPDPHVCTSSESTMGTYLRVYVAYMQKNPKLLDTRRSLGLESALSEAYPCPSRR
jgi:hypothetical protein